MSTVNASRTARALARQHNIDLQSLNKGVYVISLQDVMDYLDRRSPTRTITQKRAPVFVPLASKVRLYQWESVAQMHNRSGFVIAPCGCGKTLIGLLVAVLNGGRFMILTTRYAEQWRRTLEDFFSPIDKNLVIVVNDPPRPGIFPNVVIATYSAFCPLSERTRMLKHLVYDTIVLDEAHAAASIANLAMLDRLHGLRWCALTATLVREDKELTKLEERIGAVHVEIDRIRLVREGFIPDVQISNIVVPYEDDTYQLEASIGKNNALALHPNKMQALLHILKTLSNENHKIIVFCDDLFCLDWTFNIVKATDMLCIGCISMTTPMEERSAILGRFDATVGAAILMISRTGDEALDVPSASAGIVFWNNWASRRQIVQRIGRLSRQHGNKSPLFLTLLADNIKEEKASKHRESYMRQHGFEVVTTKFQESRYATALRTAAPYVEKLKAKYASVKTV